MKWIFAKSDSAYNYFSCSECGHFLRLFHEEGEPIEPCEECELDYIDDFGLDRELDETLGLDGWGTA